MGQEIETKSIIVEVEPVLTNFATPYTSGDQLGVAIKLTNAMDDTNGTGILLSMNVLDKNKTKKGFDVRIFNAQPTTVADNAALSYSDADAAKLLGIVSVIGTDYVDSALSSNACIKNIGLVLKSSDLTRDLWAVFSCTEAATYAALNDLNIKFGILQD